MLSLLLGTKVPWTKVPENEGFRKRKFPGTKVPRDESLEDESSTYGTVVTENGSFTKVP